MDMIKKIAFTASTMLFLLAQIFSFYVIHVSRQDKIDLLKAQEEKVFSNCLSDMTSELGRVKKGGSVPDYIMVYCFRDNMPEGTALYKDGKELYNRRKT